MILLVYVWADVFDRGNARLIGLQATVLDNSDTNYELALSCFYITYILLSVRTFLSTFPHLIPPTRPRLTPSQVPGTLLARQVNPSRSIAAGALIWSIAAVCQAGSTNRAGVFVCRLFIGVGEALFGQAMAFHLSLWYTRFDLAKRIGFFISAGTLAGAFGGLIAFGVTHISNSSIPKWRILFLIEGLPVFVLAVCVALFMPSRPDQSKYLNENERTLCITRLNADGSFESASGIEWAGVRRCFLDWKTYVVSIM
jgi:MFS family permease